MKRSGMKLLISGMLRHQKMLSLLEGEAAKRNHMAAELSRFTHAIEKGLSMGVPRPGFGRDKLNEMMRLICRLEASASSYHQEVCLAALDALAEYAAYHRARGCDGMEQELEGFLKDHWLEHSGKYGGITEVRKADCIMDGEAIEKLFHTRHSIRDFSEEDVEDGVLEKALKLAFRAPSACNRQAVRAYVLQKDKSQALAKDLSGAGGFAEKASRLILITAKLSAYRRDETNQYIVSASMYAAYLSLALHAYGLGACIIQQQVAWSREWERQRTAFGIPEDEQLILLVAVGNMKDVFRAPVSHRLENEEMIRFL